MNEIINILKIKKSIPLDKFINISLYDKKFGYYIKKNPFGKDGDFITSPLVSNLFGEMLAIWCVAFWEHIGKPSKILLVELGPGDGSLCRDLLKTFKKFKNFYNSLEINLLEVSDQLKIIQSHLDHSNLIDRLKMEYHLSSSPQNQKMVCPLPILRVSQTWFDQL